MCKMAMARRLACSVSQAQRVIPSIQHLHTTSYHYNVEASSSSSTPPKRPSPYRLLPPHLFLSQFAPLHIQGWRLDTLNRPGSDTTTAEATGPEPQHEPWDIGEEAGDFVGKRLVRCYDFPSGSTGWKGVMSFSQRAGEIIAEEDHHPILLISPRGDYTPTSSALSIPEPPIGYIIEMSTHTHTPLPPFKARHPAPTAESATTGRQNINPGVTGKDLNLAEKIEHLYKEMQPSI